MYSEISISVISSHSEKPVANFNIVNLIKNAEEFFPNKKAHLDLNLLANIRAECRKL